MISVLFRNTANKFSSFNQTVFLLLRKPKVVLFWLTRAHWAQLVLLGVLVFFPVFMPKYVDQALDRIYKPVSEKILFGLIERKRPHPKLAERQYQVKLVLWSASIGIVLLLLWLDVPKALRRAEQRVRDYEAEADENLATHPSRSVLLYRSAIALASNPDVEQQITSKLTRLDQQLSRVAQHSNINPPVDHTFVLSDEEQNGTTQQSLISGERYRLETELGKGAMGTVYSAHDELLERCVAIKELAIHLADNEQLRGRFIQEAKALARLAHPNIVQVYDFIVEENRTCIVMEYVNSLSLEEYLKVNQNLSLDKAITLARQLTDAMAYAHKRGVIHRDFKPANVLLTKKHIPKITDFGLAKITNSSIDTQTGTIMGSPAYMSPEQAVGEATDERSDIYSLGITLYRMLTGQLPFEGQATEVMAKQVNVMPPPPHTINKDIPAHLNNLIMNMLVKDPEHRIQSMIKVSRLLK